MCADIPHKPDENQEPSKKSSRKSGKRKITKEDLKDPKVRKVVLKKLKEKKKSGQKVSLKESSKSSSPGSKEPPPSLETKEQSTTQEPRAQRYVPTHTISRNQYCQSTTRLQRRTLVNVISFSFMTLIALICIALFIFDRYRRGQIFDHANAAMAALEQDQNKRALNHMNQALDIYSRYHVLKPEFWWNGDGSLFTLMLRVAQGYRALGEYEEGIETFRQVCLHNSEGEGNWVANKIYEELLDFTEKDHWLDRECSAIYEHLLQQSPEDWGTGEIVLIRATEWMGLNAISMDERFQRAEFAAYAEPFERPSIQKENVFSMKVIRYYIVDRLPEILDLHLAQSMKDYERERFLWYMNSNRKCLLFGRFVGDGALFDGVANILLSEKENVERFNRVVIGPDEEETEIPGHNEES